MEFFERPNASTWAAWCPLSVSHTPRPIVIGALGTSLTWGADLPDRASQAWPARLQAELRAAAVTGDPRTVVCRLRTW